MAKAKKKVIKKKTTRKALNSRVAVILDRSGSMNSIRREAVDAFNQQVEAIRKASKNTKVSLFTFSTIADEPTVFNVPAKDVKALDLNQYIPDGMTAMYDSVGLALDRLEALPESKDKNTTFLVVIISDGEENNSKRFTSQLIAERVQKLQKTKRWTFAYMGANQDLAKVQANLGLSAGNTFAFVASSAGMAQGAATNTVATANYLGNVARGVTSSTNFYNPDDTLVQGTSDLSQIVKTTK